MRTRVQALLPQAPRGGMGGSRLAWAAAGQATVCFGSAHGASIPVAPLFHGCARSIVNPQASIIACVKCRETGAASWSMDVCTAGTEVG